MDLEKQDIEWAITMLITVWLALRKPKKSKTPKQRKHRPKRKRK